MTTPVHIAVKVLATSASAALVEWQVGRIPHRVVVPPEALFDGKCSPETLAAGIPYGRNWAAVLTGRVGERMARLIHDELHVVGIWTDGELLRAPNAAAGAIQAAYGVDLAALLTIARQS